MASREKPAQIVLGVWLPDLRATYETGRIWSGGQALLQVLGAQLEQASGYVAGLSGDVMLERGLGSWQADFVASVERLRYMATKFTEIARSADPPELKLVAMQNYIAGPILDGRYPAPMLAALAPEYKRGILVLPDGSGKGFGDAAASASLWNQAVVASDFDHTWTRGVLEDAVRRMLTTAAVQVEESAPGEYTTLADVTGDSLRALADAPGKILAAVGIGSGTLLVVGAGAGVLLLWWLSR